MIVYANISISDNLGNIFNIQLDDSKVVIKGESSTGKSLFINALFANIAITRVYEKVRIVDMPTVEYNILPMLKSLNGNLIVINNIYSISKDLQGHIQEDNNNQYILITRMQLDINSANTIMEKIDSTYKLYYIREGECND